MRTTKEGQLPSGRLFVGICFHCRWEGEAQLSELTVSSDGRYGTDYHCTCPTKGCGKQVFFSPKRGNTEKYIDRSAEKYGGEQ